MDTLAEKTAVTQYIVRPAPSGLKLEADCEDWNFASPAPLNHFHPRSSDHRPRTVARLMYGPTDLFLRFDVDDCYVLSRHQNYQDNVCKDSCVEFFVQPRRGLGHLNFEINCGGTMLLSYIEDPIRVEQGSPRSQKVPETLGQTVQIVHTMPRRIETEISDPVQWSIFCRIPLKVLETYVGALGSLKGQQWRGNFYKCADHSSHPHWGSWAPQGTVLNFHQTAFFGDLCFA